MDKIPVYFMPGLAASPAIFEKISLPKDQFEMVFLEWQIPLDNELLTDYAKRIAQMVTLPNPVLVGVSFGGILVQEMAQYLKPRKVIIISSVRSNTEFPRRMKVTKLLRAYKLIPNDVVNKVERLARLSSSQFVKQRMKLYDKFLSVRDDRYFQWAIRNVILWERTQIDPKVVHIHGDADEVFPMKYIKDCHVIKGGTHIMILNKFRWLNEHLPKIILAE